VGGVAGRELHSRWRASGTAGKVRPARKKKGPGLKPLILAGFFVGLKPHANPTSTPRSSPKYPTLIPKSSRGGLFSTLQSISHIGVARRETQVPFGNDKQKGTRAFSAVGKTADSFASLRNGNDRRLRNGNDRRLRNGNGRGLRNGNGRGLGMERRFPSGMTTKEA